MSGRNLTMKIRQKALDERGPSTFMFTLKVPPPLPPRPA